MKLRLALALLALASPAFAQSLPTPNLGCAFKINGVTVNCPAVVAIGGTGVSTLAGIVKANGTSPFSAAAAGTDYVAPGGSAGAIDVTTQAVDNNTTKAASTAFVLGQAAAAIPLIDGTAAVGTSTRYARGDHVHPTDTTRAPLAGPTFTGTPAAPTAAVDTNTTQLATTAFVLAQSASATPLVDGTAAAGTSTRFARADHVHPTDTSRAALASPTFTGTPAAPTAAVDTNTTQLATTAFVLGQAASATPLINGTAAVGTSTRYSRADHVHPTDTTRAAASTTITPSGSITGGGDLSANRTLAYSGDGTWTSYTPAVTCPGGGSTTTTTLAGAYKLIATKTVAFRAKAVLGTNSGCLSVALSLPFTTVGDISLTGREPAVTGKMFGGNATAGASAVSIFYYDNTTAAANGASFSINSTYEIP